MKSVLFTYTPRRFCGKRHARDRSWWSCCSCATDLYCAPWSAPWVCYLPGMSHRKSPPSQWCSSCSASTANADVRVLQRRASQVIRLVHVAARPLRPDPKSQWVAKAILHIKTEQCVYPETVAVDIITLSHCQKQTQLTLWAAQQAPHPHKSGPTPECRNPFSSHSRQRIVRSESQWRRSLNFYYMYATKSQTKVSEIYDLATQTKILYEIPWRPGSTKNCWVAKFANWTKDVFQL